MKNMGFYNMSLILRNIANADVLHNINRNITEHWWLPGPIFLKMQRTSVRVRLVAEESYAFAVIFTVVFQKW